MADAPVQDDRKLIPAWIREESARREHVGPQLAVSAEVEEQIRRLATEAAETGAKGRQELEAARANSWRPRCLRSTMPAAWRHGRC